MNAWHTSMAINADITFSRTSCGMTNQVCTLGHMHRNLFSNGMYAALIVSTSRGAFVRQFRVSMHGLCEHECQLVLLVP